MLDAAAGTGFCPRREQMWQWQMCPMMVPAALKDLGGFILTPEEREGPTSKDWVLQLPGLPAKCMSLTKTLL